MNLFKLASWTLALAIAPAATQPLFSSVPANLGVPTLTRTGTCPGLVTLTFSNCTPRQKVFFVYGQAGSFTKPTGNCTGMTINISRPTLGASVLARTGGGGQMNLSIPPSGCGITVQCVDWATCTPTNTVTL